MNKNTIKRISTGKKIALGTIIGALLVPFPALATDSSSTVYNLAYQENSYANYGAPNPLNQGVITVNYGETHTIYSDFTGNLIVNDGGILRLVDDFTITGHVQVNAGGSFYMSNGTITGAGSRGVTVTGAYSFFQMSGGRIYGNSTISQVGGPTGNGGGVLLQQHATFQMLDGLIANNQGSSWNINSATGGGVEVGMNSRFSMFGREISNNRLSNPNGGAGVNVSNSANGASPGIFDMMGGRISNHYHTPSQNPQGGVTGGGVRVVGIFNMSYGEISSNTATQGGGVAVIGQHASFSMFSSPLIHSNVATIGGGVRVDGNGYFETSGESTIYNNTALGFQASQGGGGVSVGNGRFYMRAGHVIGNHSPAFGAGVALMSETGSVFRMYDGTIAENALEAVSMSGGGAGIFWAHSAILENMFISNVATVHNNRIGSGLFLFSNSLAQAHGHRINPSPWSGLNNEHAFNHADINTSMISVSFLVNGGTRPDGGPQASMLTQFIDDGEYLPIPDSIPIRSGYRFSGWYVEPTGVTPFDFSTAVFVPRDPLWPYSTSRFLRIYANWEPVDGNQNNDNEDVTEPSTTLPAEPDLVPSPTPPSTPNLPTPPSHPGGGGTGSWPPNQPSLPYRPTYTAPNSPIDENDESTQTPSSTVVQGNPNLPQTGTVSTFANVFAGIGLIASSTGYVIVKKKK